MLVALWLLVLVSCDLARGKISGEHVCQEERRSTINITEYVVRNTTVRNYEWCMNVPPRCSFYTIKPINVSQVVEKEVIDLIGKCCSGFIQDKASNTCIPECPPCLNGSCKNAACSCIPGFMGDLCDSECSPGHWGQDCKHICECMTGSCNPKNGSCTCPPGLIGEKCEARCEDGFFGLDCQQQCKCPENNSCEAVTGQCPTTTTTTATTTATTTPSTSEFTVPVIPVKSNGKFQFNDTIFTTIHPLVVESGFKADNHVSSDHDLLTTDEPSPMLQATNRVKKLEVDKNEDVGNKDLVNSASTATAVSIGIIVVAVVIVAVRRFKGRKKNKMEMTTNGVSTVAVYTHSIFHTPLPDPPIFEGPVVTPLDSNSSNEGRFETHVVCSMNFPTQAIAIDPRDYLYDHPPSTGSYRAASIPEPPDSECKLQSEPLYDEIPAGAIPISEPPPSYKTSSLYMNTFGKTRF